MVSLCIHVLRFARSTSNNGFSFSYQLGMCDAISASPCAQLTLIRRISEFSSSVPSFTSAARTSAVRARWQIAVQWSRGRSVPCFYVSTQSKHRARVGNKHTKVCCYLSQLPVHYGVANRLSTMIVLLISKAMLMLFCYSDISYKKLKDVVYRFSVLRKTLYCLLVCQVSR